MAAGRNPESSAGDLPPPFRLVVLRDAEDAFAHAQAVAAVEGAGALVQAGGPGRLEFAVVLEPSEPLRTARLALYVGLLAMADALAGFAPPLKPIHFDWPGAIWLDGAAVGEARLAWPSGTAEDAQPDWLVFGVVLRTGPSSDPDPGLTPLITTLYEEAFDEVSDAELVERFARHLMAAFDLYAVDLETLKASYLNRLQPEEGRLCGLDAQGDLLVFAPTGAIMNRRSLRDALTCR